MLDLPNLINISTASDFTEIFRDVKSYTPIDDQSLYYADEVVGSIRLINIDSFQQNRSKQKSRYFQHLNLLA